MQFMPDRLKEMDLFALPAFEGLVHNSINEETLGAAFKAMTASLTKLVVKEYAEQNHNSNDVAIANDRNTGSLRKNPFLRDLERAGRHEGLDTKTKAQATNYIQYSPRTR